MRRINARRIIALMTNQQSKRNWSISQFIKKSMSRIILSIFSRSKAFFTVTVFVFQSQPYPARRANNIGSIFTNFIKNIFHLDEVIAY